MGSHLVSEHDETFINLITAAGEFKESLISLETSLLTLQENDAQLPADKRSQVIAVLAHMRYALAEAAAKLAIWKMNPEKLFADRIPECEQLLVSANLLLFRCELLAARLE